MTVLVLLLALAVAFVSLFAVAAIRRHDSLHRDVVTELERRAAELQFLNAELERANRDLEDFANVASHDLREPLLVIEGFSGLLQRRAAGQLDADGQRFVANIGLGVERMQLIINGLLEYSRAAGTAEGASEVESGKAVEMAIARLAEQIEETGAAVTLGPLPKLWAGQVGLEQLFEHLIGNALKFTDGRPAEVEVSGRPSDGLGWEFSIADNGVGVDPDRADEAFEIFRRLHPASVPGPGIGLATCRRIVGAHGGRIWVEPGEGGGSVFRFTIADRARERRLAPRPTAAVQRAVSSTEDGTS